MPTPRSCVQCLTPFAELPPGGSCPVCGTAVELIDTPDVTPAGPDTPIQVPETPAYVPADPFGSTPFADSASGVTALLEEDLPRLGRLPVLPNYDVLKPVGSGGMGIVYQAMQTGVGRLVALKVIQGPGSLDSRQRARFKTEAEALGRLAHPNVVTVYDLGEADGTPYYSMEFVAGGTLADRLREAGRLPPAEAVGLVASAAAGVAAAHRVGVLHRDLKPSNMLVAADGTVKVGDFGLAKLLDRDDGPTHTGQVVGTPSYMAPEQAGGSAPIGPHTDVYGLGATLYHLLTGRPPFKEETPMGTAVRVLNEVPLAPRQVCPELCPVLEAVVLKAMAKAPSGRYASARALADDLMKWRRGEPTSVRPATRWQKAQRWLLRNRVAAVVAVAVVLAAAVVVAKREMDPGRKVRRAIVRGDTATLIGPTGRPAAFRWAQGEVKLADALTEDGTCGFQTHDRSLLELCPDPARDRYRFAADCRHLRATGVDSAVGVYVGWTDAGDVRRWVAFEFNDFWAGVEMDRPDWKAEHAVRAKDYLGLRGPDRTRTSAISAGAFPFPPADRVLNPWRTLVVDVTPAGLTASWRADEQSDALVPAVTVSAADLHRRTASHQGTLNQSAPAPAPAPTAPPWAIRGGIGVFAYNAAAAFRNVTLTPTDP